MKLCLVGGPRWPSGIFRSSSPPDLVRPAAHESLFYTSPLDWIFLLNFLLSRSAGRLAKSPAMPNGRCRMHGGTNPGAPKGNKHAFKHGRYTAEAIASRREVAELLRAMRSLARDTEEAS
jgi:hypothetical protein